MDYTLYYKNYGSKFIVYESEKTENNEKILKDYENYISLFEESFNFLLPLMLDSFLYLNIFHSKLNTFFILF
jgi:hypothetical protein